MQAKEYQYKMDIKLKRIQMMSWLRSLEILSVIKQNTFLETINRQPSTIN